MQEKRNIRLLIFLGISTLALVGLLYLSTRNDFDVVDKQLFKVDDQTTISKVVIKPVTGQPVELQFTNGKWRVNNMFDADQQMIKILFATLLQTEPRREVAASIQDSVSKYITSTGREIQLYSDEHVVKQFWVGGNTRKTETYFQTPEGVPYLVQIPGYRLYIASVFELPAIDWRDKWIFNFNWQNFKSLRATFYNQPNEDFVVARQQTFFGITGMPAADTARLNNYLDAVSLVQANRFITTEPDSLVKAEPSFTIQVADIANRSYMLEVYPSGQKATEFPARLNGETWLVLSRASLEEIDRKRTYFGK